MFRIAYFGNLPEENHLFSRYSECYSVKYDNQVVFEGFSNKNDLINKYVNGMYDLMLLDISDDTSEGIFIAKHIRHIPDHNVVIVYISDSKKYISASFDVRAAYYMVRPITYELFEKIICKTISYAAEDKNNFIYLKTSNERYILNVSNIISIEVVGKWIIFTTNIETIKIRGTLKNT